MEGEEGVKGKRGEGVQLDLGGYKVTKYVGRCTAQDSHPVIFGILVGFCTGTMYVNP